MEATDKKASAMLDKLEAALASHKTSLFKEAIRAAGRALLCKVRTEKDWDWGGGGDGERPGHRPCAPRKGVVVS